MPGIPSIIVTGASGIVGRGFLEEAKEDFLIYAIARRSQRQAGVIKHPNIKWIQVDIGNRELLAQVMQNIKQQGGADYVFHLAAYYDFDYKDHPEYERTNVNGTRYMLEESKELGIKRFIFPGSTAACKFPAAGDVINEKTPVDAEYDYALSKKKGEELVTGFSRWFPCSIVRFAAVFSDWCEYGVLYMFLSTWLSKKWNARVLGGKGQSGVPFIHTKDLSRLILKIIGNSDRLPALDTYIAGPDGSVSHRQLYETATRFYYGKKRKAFLVPKFMALPGVIVRYFIGKLIGRPPFERPWMIKYLDCKLSIDSSYTRRVLSWEPAPRYHILRRLLFLVERMKSDPVEWHRKNADALNRDHLRPNIIIYEAMLKLKNELIPEIKETILAPGNKDVYPDYHKVDENHLDWYVEIIYQLLSASVRNDDRMLLLDYIRDLANIRFHQGFTCSEICRVLSEIGSVICSRLKAEPGLKDLGDNIGDYIMLTLQLTADEVEEAFEKLEKQAGAKAPQITDIEEKLHCREAFYRSVEG